MKTEKEIEDKIIETRATRDEIANNYKLMAETDRNDWRGKSLERRWERADAELTALRWVLGNFKSQMQ